MDPTTIKTVVAVVAVVITATMAAAQLWFRHVDQRTALRKSYDVRIEAQGELLKIHGTRLERLETRMDNVATRTDLAALDKTITAIVGKVDVVDARLQPFVHTVERLEEFLLRPRAAAETTS